MHRLSILLICTALTLPTQASAQNSTAVPPGAPPSAAFGLTQGRGEPANLPIVGKVRPFAKSFAPTDNPGPRAAVVGEKVLVFPGAGFVQVEFGQVSLPNDGYLELTSLADGDSEILRGGQSAYFNGNAVRVRLWAGPASRGTFARIVSVATGEGIALRPLSLCSRVDNRRPLNDKRVARLLLRTNATVLVCTGFLFSSTNCFATAGACLLTRNLRSVTAQFNVPLSNSNGTINNPPASSQYAWAGAASSRSANTGVSNNWGVFLTRTNSTGRHAGQNQGAFFRFTATTQTKNTLTKVVGYGTSLIKTRNATQQLHIGTLSSFSGNQLCFRTDTTAGNEGSPVVNANNDLVFGVVTAGGCFRLGGCNFGTASRNAAFAAARAALCKPPAPGSFTFFGLGCGGASKVPLLSNTGTPSIGKTMRLDISNARPFSRLCFCFGGSRTRWGGLILPFSLRAFGAPGCFLNVACPVVIAGFSSSAGTFAAPLRIPNNPSLVGQTFFTQVLVRDASANRLGLTFTRGGAGKIGG